MEIAQKESKSSDNVKTNKAPAPTPYPGFNTTATPNRKSGQKSRTSVKTSQTDRFSFQTPTNEASANLFGTYDVQAGQTIGRKNALAKALDAARRDAKTRQTEADRRYSEMYPGIYGPAAFLDDQNNALPSYLSAQEVASAKTPGPDAYARQKSGYEVESGAESRYGSGSALGSSCIRPALLPATAKYPRQAPSIPGIQGGAPAERAQPARPIRQEPFKL